MACILIIILLIIKHVTTLKHRNNVRLINGEKIKNGDKFDCVSCKTSLSQYSVEQHFKTKMHLDKVGVMTKDPRSGYTNLRSSFTDTSGYCDICNTRYDNKKKHIESEQYNENIKEKKLVDEKWRDKVNELGLDHNMNQKIVNEY